MVGFTSVIDAQGHKVNDEDDDYRCFYARKVSPLSEQPPHVEDLDGNILSEEP